jgi:hypothetical protein
MRKIDTIQQNEQRRQKLANTAASAVKIITDTIQKLSKVNEEIDTEIETIVSQKNALEATMKQYVEAKEQNTKVIDKFRSFIED